MKSTNGNRKTNGMTKLLPMDTKINSIIINK